MVFLLSRAALPGNNMATLSEKTMATTARRGLSYSSLPLLCLQHSSDAAYQKARNETQRVQRTQNKVAHERMLDTMVICMHCRVTQCHNDGPWQRLHSQLGGSLSRVLCPNPSVTSYWKYFAPVRSYPYCSYSASVLTACWRPRLTIRSVHWPPGQKARRRGSAVYVSQH